MTDAEKILAILRGGAESIAPTLAPDEDWAPVCICLTAEGKQIISNLPPYENEQEKARAMLTLSAFLKHQNAVAAGLLTTAWLVMHDLRKPGTLIGGLRPSEHPAREEVVWAYAVDRLSEGAIYARATITRSDGPPTLSEWEEHQSDKVEGLMVEPVYAAVKESKVEEILH